MVITKKSLSRRTILRGLGAAIALPVLDGMIPAFASAATRSTKRVGALYAPNGMSMPFWTPATEGPLVLSPIMAPLEKVKDKVVVLTGTSNMEAAALLGEGDGDHSRSQAAYLTAAHAAKSSGTKNFLQAGVSMDQVAARQFEKETQLASLELSLEANDLLGQCEDGYGCGYSGTIAWRDEKTPLPMETNPRAVFEHMFGVAGSTERNARLRGLKADRSILDSVTAEINGLQKRLGGGDRNKLTGYLDSVRDIERRIQIAEAQSDRELPEVAYPGGIPAAFEEYANLMFDLWLVAWQTDLTRVTTFLYGREKSVRVYTEIGVAEPHHPVSHHMQRADYLEKLAKINTYHMKAFARFVEKLQATPDGDGNSLLDNSVIMYGAGMGNSNAHQYFDLPILLAGGGGAIKGGRHIRLKKDTPLANVHLTVLEKVGVPVEKFGDSTGPLAVISGV